MEGKQARTSNMVVYIAIVVAWLLCAYLVYYYSQLNNGGGTPFDLCQSLFGHSCHTALTSPIASHLGYPLAGWGMAYFGFIGLLISFKNRIADQVLVITTALAVGVSVILSFILVRTSLNCAVCLLIHLLNFIVFFFIFFKFQHSIGKPVNEKTIINRKKIRWSLLLVFAIFLGAILEKNVLKASIDNQPPANLDAISEAFKSSKTFNIPTNDSSPSLGSKAAPVKIVVFSSFQCPACKSFASTLKPLQKKYGEDILVTFKNFPLSSNCNPVVMENMQPHSCNAAFAAISASKQNHFWDYHDQLFQTDLSFEENTLVSIAKDLNLNLEKWKRDMQSDEAKKMLLADIKLAYEIGINATPTVLINGKKVNNLDEKVLAFLIDNELHKH